MAVSLMKKLSVISPKGSAKKLIRELQRLGCVEVICTDDDASLPISRDARIAKLSATLEAAQKAVSFLTEYTEGKEISLDAPQISLDDFEAGLDIIAEEAVHKTLRLQERINSAKNETSELHARLGALTPFIGQAVALPYHKTAHTYTASGSFPELTDFAALKEKLGERGYHIELLGSEKDSIYASVTCHKADEAEVRKIINSAGFALTTAHAADPAAEAEELREKLSSALDKLAELRSKAKRQSEKLLDFKVLCDICETRLERERAMEKCRSTAFTVRLCGWVPEREVKRVEELLQARGCAWELSEPREGDDVPTLMQNNRFTKNFEPVLSMYSLPRYGEFDPTSVMALFYIIIFGMMFADVGYGLLVFFGCLAGIKLLKPNEGLKKMLIMFAICAVSCILFGVLFGGYFGDLPVSILENFMGHKNVGSPAVLFDMIENPIAMLGVSLGVGALHLITAMIVKMYILIRDGDVFAAIFDVGSWLIVFAGIGIYFLNSTVGIVIALVGVAMLILTQGRHKKNIFMKLISGIMSLYDIINYASDLLSYSRILALSLASSVIAMVVNMLATMGGFSAIGLLMFLIVFLIGHAINFGINLLGTYVHTSRLQYLEFLGKFYEGGGREFSPLRNKSNYVNFK